ncbi:MAG: uncharacterized protein JWO86_5568 [Myxococcaceae bacterium]|nr:uncharacterized protein [Myxococcaceae bacterium]
MSARGAALLLVLGVSSCAGGCGAPPTGTAEPPRYAPEDQTSARAAKATTKPLVLEWPAADRAALEVQRARGIVVVRYAQHEMEVLRGCTIDSAYRYAAVTPKEEGLVFRTADELDAAMPIHAVGLEAKLRQRKALSVGMTIVGMYESDGRVWRGTDLVGDCAAATHVVRALTVGAFEIAASAEINAGVSAKAAGMGAAYSHDDAREILHRDGNKGACAKASPRDTGPPYDCGAPLRVEVAAIQFAATSARARSTVPGAPAGTCADGLVRKGDACVAVDPDRPDLLDVLKPTK